MPHRWENQSHFQRKKISALCKTNHADTCVSSSTSSTQQHNNELHEELRNPAYPTLEQSFPHLTPLVSVHSETKTEDSVGKTCCIRGRLKQMAPHTSAYRDVPQAQTGYLWQRLMLLKDCCGACMVNCLAPTHLRTGQTDA